MLTELLAWVGQHLGIAGQLGIAIPMIALFLYWRKALKVFGVGADMIGKIVIAVVIIGIGIALGVLNVDVGRAANLLGDAFRIVSDFI
jgi:hypothetical protein